MIALLLPHVRSTKSSATSCAREHLRWQNSPSRSRFRPPTPLTFAFRLRPPRSASSYSRPVLGAGATLGAAGVRFKGGRRESSRSLRLCVFRAPLAGSFDPVPAHLRHPRVTISPPRSRHESTRAHPLGPPTRRRPGPRGCRHARSARRSVGRRLPALLVRLELRLGGQVLARLLDRRRRGQGVASPRSASR